MIRAPISAGARGHIWMDAVVHFHSMTSSSDIHIGKRKHACVWISIFYVCKNMHSTYYSNQGQIIQAKPKND